MDRAPALLSPSESRHAAGALPASVVTATAAEVASGSDPWPRLSRHVGSWSGLMPSPQAVPLHCAHASRRARAGSGVLPAAARRPAPPRPSHRRSSAISPRGWRFDPAHSRARELHPEMLRVIYNGIEPGPPPEPRVPLPADLGPHPARPVVLTAARLAPQKGIAHLLDAWARLALTFPEASCWWPGGSPLRPDLEAQVVPLASPHRCASSASARIWMPCCGRPTWRRPRSLKDNRSSLWKQWPGSPGRCLACRRAPGDGTRGRTRPPRPPGDPPALAAAMARLLNNQELASTMARRRARSSRRSGPWRGCWPGYRGLYREVWHTVKR